MKLYDLLWRFAELCDIEVYGDIFEAFVRLEEMFEPRRVWCFSDLVDALTMPGLAEAIDLDLDRARELYLEALKMDVQKEFEHA